MQEVGRTAQKIHVRLNPKEALWRLVSVRQMRQERDYLKLLDKDGDGQAQIWFAPKQHPVVEKSVSPAGCFKTVHAVQRVAPVHHRWVQVILRMFGRGPWIVGSSAMKDYWTLYSHAQQALHGWNRGTVRLLEEGWCIQETRVGQDELVCKS